MTPAFVGMAVVAVAATLAWLLRALPRRTAITVAVLMAGLTGIGYGVVGNPARLADGPGHPTSFAEQLQALQAQGRWAELARLQAGLGRLQESEAAFRKALAEQPADAGLLADAADVMAARQGRRMAGEPASLVARALAAEPDHVKSLALAGVAAQQRQDFDSARAAWQHALRLTPQDDPLAQQLRERMASLPH